jgi:hypothetical protein
VDLRVIDRYQEGSTIAVAVRRAHRTDVPTASVDAAFERAVLQLLRR